MHRHEVGNGSFSRTARKTKKINLGRTLSRGGIRL